MSWTWLTYWLTDITQGFRHWLPLPCFFLLTLLEIQYLHDCIYFLFLTFRLFRKTKTKIYLLIKGTLNKNTTKWRHFRMGRQRLPTLVLQLFGKNVSLQYSWSGHLWWHQLFQGEGDLGFGGDSIQIWFMITALIFF